MRLASLNVGYAAKDRRRRAVRSKVTWPGRVLVTGVGTGWVAVLFLTSGTRVGQDTCFSKKSMGLLRYSLGDLRGYKSVVYRLSASSGTTVCEVRHVQRVHQRLGILPYLRCVRPEREPHSNEVRLNEAIRCMKKLDKGLSLTKTKIPAHQFIKSLTVC